jgi:hypothetical protein
MTDPSLPGHPVGPEIDDSQNMTNAAPSEGSRVQTNVRDMLVQLQAMIDAVAVQAGPVLREVAAKAAELAAVAGEHAGPLAYKAAEKTQSVGRRVAERGKEVAADLRRPQVAEADAQADGGTDASPEQATESAAPEMEAADEMPAEKGWGED